ncbi:MAG: bifunctional lysylphosphatidylglycerol synthetase/lysine--tRNA ligase LysX, partial [Nocardioidaceae bacterium]
VTRSQRAGYHARVLRHAELTEAQLGEIITKAETWRGGQTERGFSMALNRLADPADGRCVMVLAYDDTGELKGLLSFVPWGVRGLSLDLMRRHPDSVNGLMEFMVSALIDACEGLRVRHVSLNFAMFREVFSEADKVGAGPVLKLTNAALTLASRFWQLESLYLSNAKYLPRWTPRFICYDRNGSLTQALIAAGMAEGFLRGPRLLRRRASTEPGSMRPALGPVAFAERVRQQELDLSRPALPERRVGEQERVRRRKLDALRAEGMDPYPVSVPRTASLQEVHDDHPALPPGERTGTTVSVTGRIMSIRDHGRLCFATLSEDGVSLQVMLEQAACDQLPRWRRCTDIGDEVSITGQVVTTRSGELTVSASSWRMAAKCLHPLPDTRVGFTDPELRVRRRHLDLMMNADSLALMVQRGQAVRALRVGFERRGFSEVETPMLHGVHGGANARPFVTHLNALDTDVFLRIAPELYLKRLCVAGMSKVFELNRSFRNEGTDSSHNPEFTSVEAYQAYADYTTMRDLTRELIIEMATAVYGKPIVRRLTPGGSAVDVDISGPWETQTVHQAVSAAVGTEVDTTTPDSQLRELARAYAVRTPPDASQGHLVTRLYEDLVEQRTELPTFYVDFPIETSPLTRAHRHDPRLAERWDLVAFGLEIGTAYSELSDPIEQRRRLTAQSLRAAAGDTEAMSLDEDFLTALEYGLPPTGGLGLGVDRLVMLLTGQNIRRTLAFPFTKRA